MTNTRTEPSAADQLLFLSRVQRLLDSGRFSATYKFALFLALAELAVERGEDTDARIRIPLEVIADRFLRLYWKQAAPYPTTGSDAVLRQNSGKNAAIINKIANAHKSLGLSLGEAQRRPGWLRLLRDARRIVVKMPLMKLQTIGRDGTATRAECFLYPNAMPDDEIELLPGVAFCLRRFFPLLQGMVRAKWLSWVQAQNKDILGSVQDLESFMFGASRTETRGLRAALFEIQGGRCFYQPRRRLDVKTAHIDHFIPWAKYPCDAVANLVLASPRANADKKDHLAAAAYLGRWRNRNEAHGDRLAAVAGAASVEVGTSAVERVAAWAYGIHEGIGGLVWHASDGLVRLDPTWRDILRV